MQPPSRWRYPATTTVSGVSARRVLRCKSRTGASLDNPGLRAEGDALEERNDRPRSSHVAVDHDPAQKYVTASPMLRNRLNVTDVPLV
jgi:hypothetical protein